MGVVIALLRRVDSNWYQARLDGRIGLVPCSYVTVIQPLPGQSSIDEGEQTVGRRREGGREKRERGREGRREGEREGGRERVGEREGGREGGR